MDIIEKIDLFNKKSGKKIYALEDEEKILKDFTLTRLMRMANNSKSDMFCKEYLMIDEDWEEMESMDEDELEELFQDVTFANLYRVSVSNGDEYERGEYSTYEEAYKRYQEAIAEESEDANKWSLKRGVPLEVVIDLYAIDLNGEEDFVDRIESATIREA